MAVRAETFTFQSQVRKGEARICMGTLENTAHMEAAGEREAGVEGVPGLEPGGGRSGGDKAGEGAGGSGGLRGGVQEDVEKIIAGRAGGGGGEGTEGRGGHSRIASICSRGALLEICSRARFNIRLSRFPHTCTMIIRSV